MKEYISVWDKKAWIVAQPLSVPPMSTYNVSIYITSRLFIFTPLPRVTIYITATHADLGMPEVTLRPPVEDNTIIIDLDSPSDIELECNVSAHPIPSLSWSRDGASVEGEQNITGFR